MAENSVWNSETHNQRYQDWLTNEAPKFQGYYTGPKKTKGGGLWNRWTRGDDNEHRAERSYFAEQRDRRQSYLDNVLFPTLNEQVDAYNQSVNQFNANVGSFRNKFQGLESLLDDKGFNTTFWDNPDTADANEGNTQETFGNSIGEAWQAYQNLANPSDFNFNINPDINSNPDFSIVDDRFVSQDGNWSTLDFGRLSAEELKPFTDRIAKPVDSKDSLREWLEGLQSRYDERSLEALGQRRALETGHINPLTEGLNEFELNYSDLDVNDDTAIRGAEIDAKRLEQQMQALNALENPLKPVLGSDIESVGQRVGSAGDLVRRIVGQRDAARRDVSDYQSDLANFVNQNREAFAGMGVGSNNIDSFIEGLQLKLDEAENKEFGIDNFDLSKGTTGIQGLLEAAEKLRTDRSTAIAQAEAAPGGFDARIDDLVDRIGGTGTANLRDIEALEDIESGLSGEVSDYLMRSGLQPDDVSENLLSGVEGRLSGEVADAIRQLKEKRATELIGLQDAIGGADATGVADTDENALLKLMRQLSDSGDRLKGYSGGNVGNIAELLGDRTDAVSAKLENIGEQRGLAEDNLQAALEELKQIEFFNQGQIDEARAKTEGLEDFAEKWSAAGADDEIAAIASLLGAEETRLATDAETVRQREAKAMEQVASSLQNQGRRFIPRSTSDFHLALGINNEDELLPNIDEVSAFANSIRV